MPGNRCICRSSQTWKNLVALGSQPPAPIRRGSPGFSSPGRFRGPGRRRGGSPGRTRASGIKGPAGRGGRAQPGRAAAAYPVVARAHPAGEGVDRPAQAPHVLLQVRDGAGGAEVLQQLLADLLAAADVLLLHLGAEVLHAAGLHGRGRRPPARLPARLPARGRLSPGAAQPPVRVPAGTGGTRRGAARWARRTAGAAPGAQRPPN